VKHLSFKCRIYGISPHEPCSNYCDISHEELGSRFCDEECECWCHEQFRGKRTVDIKVNPGIL